MNVLQGLDLVHIKVLRILSTDYSSSSPKQVFFLKSAFNVSTVSDTSHTELPAARGSRHCSETPRDNRSSWEMWRCCSAALGPPCKHCCEAGGSQLLLPAIPELCSEADGEREPQSSILGIHLPPVVRAQERDWRDLGTAPCSVELFGVTSWIR